ncbi:MAG: hypothetical protein AAF316_03780, partial [Cyanobacteria bacterium P01_A01_bin.80]
WSQYSILKLMSFGHASLKHHTNQPHISLALFPIPHSLSWKVALGGNPQDRTFRYSLNLIYRNNYEQVRHN